jgi:hypothetical protein
MAKAKLNGRTGFHIEVDGIVFKSQASKGRGKDEDLKRREIAALICIAVNYYFGSKKD